MLGPAVAAETGSEEKVTALDINPEKICYVIVKARELDAKVEVDDPDSGSNPTDDKGIDVLEDLVDDPTHEELKTFIDFMNEDEQVQLVALAWMGRGDFSIDEWDDAVAAAQHAHNARTAEYLLGMPMLGDYLEQAMSAFDLSCEAFEAKRL